MTHNTYMNETNKMDLKTYPIFIFRQTVLTKLTYFFLDPVEVWSEPPNLGKLFEWQG